MKRNSHAPAFRALITLLTTAFAIQGSFGQTTITKANMPISGQNIIYSTSNDTIDPLVTGPNQVWDFSGITPSAQDTYKYLPPAKAGAIYGLAFYGTVALDVKVPALKDLYQFYKTSASQYTMAGVGFTVPTAKITAPVTYDNPDIIYRFPVKYGDEDSCTFSALTSFSGYSIKIWGQRRNTVDGWGKVITPYKTYTNCIRVKSVVKELDTFLIIPIDNSRIEYKWLSPDEEIPVMEAVVTRSLTGTGASMTLYYRDSYKQNINPNGPLVDFDVADTNVLTGDTVPLNNLTTGALAYSWSISPAAFSYANGTSVASKNPELVFHAPGLYSVSLTALNTGGSNTFTRRDYINVTHNSGIAAAQNTNGFQVYPNPAHGSVVIAFNKGNLAGKKINFSVTDMLGKQVYEHDMQADGNPKMVINTSGFMPGMYFVHCRLNNQVETRKIIIK